LGYFMRRQDLNNSLVEQITTRDIDFHGRRIKNASPSADSADYTIRKELNDEVAKLVSIASLPIRVIAALASYTGTLYISATTIFRKATSFLSTVTVTGLTTLTNLLIDNGATPAASQVKLRANNLGVLALLSYAADNQQIGFDVERDGAAGVCRDDTICRIVKNGDKLNFYVATGQTPGNAPTGEVLIIEVYCNDTMVLGAATTDIAFFGGTPAAQQTLNAYTTDAESGAYTGLATGLGATPYAAVGDLNTLRVAYENLRASYDDIRTNLKNTTLVA
jgi:hypothetical protein